MEAPLLRFVPTILLKKQLFRGIASAIYTKYTDLFLQAQLFASYVWLSKQPFRNGFFTQKNAGTTVWLTMCMLNKSVV